MDKELLESACQSDCEVYQAEVRKVHEVILEEIKEALNKLFEIKVFPPIYKDFTCDIDYKTFVEKLGSAWEEKAPFGLLWNIEASDAEESLSEIEDKESLYSDILRIGHLLFSPEYNPPEEPSEILLHLVCLYVWYKADPDTQSYHFATHFSLPFGKLLAVVSKLHTISVMKAERELARTKKSAKTIKENRDKRKRFVIAIYEHGKFIEPGIKSSKVITIIRRQFKDCQGKEGPWGIIPLEMHIPSRDSIKRWLSEEGILDRDFKQDGSHWIKQM